MGDGLRGGARIAEYLRELYDDPTITAEKVYGWIRVGAIPAGKMGGQVVASKTRLFEHYDQLTKGAA